MLGDEMKFVVFFIYTFMSLLYCNEAALEKEKKRDQNTLNLLLLGLIQLSNRPNNIEIDVFDFEKNIFVRAGVQLPNSLNQSSSILLNNGSVFISGGQVGSNDTQKMNYILSKNFNSIERIIDLPNPRIGHTISQKSSGEIVVVGGSNKISKGTLIGNIEIINQEFNSISNVTQLSIPRYFHSSVTTNSGNIYIIGGLDNNQDFISEIEVYNPSNDTITTIGNLNSPRGYFNPVLHGDYIYVIGGLKKVGNNFQFSPDVERINLNDNSVQTVSSLQIPRTDYQVFKDGNVVKIIGGRTSSNESMSRIELYNLDNHTSELTSEIINHKNPKCIFNHTHNIYLGYGTRNNIALESTITNLDIPNNSERVIYDSTIVRRDPRCINVGNSKYIVFGN